MALLDLATTQQLAATVGAVQIKVARSGSIDNLGPQQYQLVFPNGAMLDAGLVYDKIYSPVLASVPLQLRIQGLLDEIKYNAGDAAANVYPTVATVTGGNGNPVTSLAELFGRLTQSINPYPSQPANTGSSNAPTNPTTSVSATANNSSTTSAPILTPANVVAALPGMLEGKVNLPVVGQVDKQTVLMAVAGLTAFYLLFSGRR